MLLIVFQCRLNVISGPFVGNVSRDIFGESRSRGYVSCLPDSIFPECWFNNWFSKTRKQPIPRVARWAEILEFIGFQNPNGYGTD